MRRRNYLAWGLARGTERVIVLGISGCRDPLLLYYTAVLLPWEGADEDAARCGDALNVPNTERIRSATTSLLGTAVKGR